MSKKEIIEEIIKINKPISIEQYIELSLYSNSGYYENSMVLGKEGDFITSPEISQLFGEILGLFIYSNWQKKINKPFNLVEFGPGRGALLIDILNITKNFEEFKKSFSIFLIEKNNTLIRKQKENLRKFNFSLNNINWLKTFYLAKDKPTIFFANEFFDCLPIRQYFKKNNHWYEKFIVYSKKNKSLTYENIKTSDIRILDELNNNGNTDILEISQSREEYFDKICKHIYLVGGIAIIIDYGYFEKPNYFTLQSLYNNKRSNVLDNIGLQDITSLVDFKKLIFLAKSNNLNIDIFCTQRDFFIKYGINERAKKIFANSNNKQKNLIKKGLKRIIDEDGMGSLFKVLVVSK